MKPEEALRELADLVANDRSRFNGAFQRLNDLARPAKVEARWQSAMARQRQNDPANLDDRNLLLLADGSTMPPDFTRVNCLRFVCAEAVAGDFREDPELIAVLVWLLDDDGYGNAKGECANDIAALRLFAPDGEHWKRVAVDALRGLRRKAVNASVSTHTTPAKSPDGGNDMARKLDGQPKRARSARNTGFPLRPTYSPNESDKSLFKALRQLVHSSPDLFADAGKALDREYSNQGIRDRKAALDRMYRLDDPCYTRETRALNRNRAPRPKRRRGAGGRLEPPQLSLAMRFEQAFKDTFFEDDTSLDALNEDEKQALAARRVLLAWLRNDPDRGKVRRITEFQDIQTLPTLTGYIEDTTLTDDQVAEYGRVLFVRRDGDLPIDAPRWIPIVREALEVVQAMRAETPDTEHLGAAMPTKSDRTHTIAAAQTDTAGENEQQAPALTNNETAKLSGEETVLALLIRHPDWSDTKLAKAAGVNRGSLYRMTRFVQAKAALKEQGKTNLQRRQHAQQDIAEDNDE